MNALWEKVAALRIAFRAATLQLPGFRQSGNWNLRPITSGLPVTREQLRKTPVGCEVTLLPLGQMGKVAIGFKTKKKDCLY
jgi:hypothetical protein